MVYASNSVKPEEIKAILNVIQTNLLIAEEHKLMCESDITLQECWFALKHLSKINLQAVIVLLVSFIESSGRK